MQTPTGLTKRIYENVEFDTREYELIQLYEPRQGMEGKSAPLIASLSQRVLEVF